ncbi:hypothetical protein Belba_3244 [Belliella baltica DSM 15883]|uniref:Uncharacterized protein n=1 Tax=Belliella baltica (strain DSM 15883 / CIP 108006 / LMG 21964 / BA134) TaxID=866536 RepID=I3Z936_BELBD|nr:hypothetical protein Belba_3244 [Belliella baltica DSM 15883]
MGIRRLETDGVFTRGYLQLALFIIVKQSWGNIDVYGK